MSQAILLTGRPGCGKTTLIRRLLASLPGPADGFYTQEIRHQGNREGFEIVTLSSERATLAHVRLQSPHRVGKYRVDLSALDTVGIDAIQRGVAAGGIVVIDEIGPMELLSGRFRQAVLDALASRATVLGTIARRSTPFTDALRARPEVKLIEVRPDNRETLVEQILALLQPG